MDLKESYIYNLDLKKEFEIFDKKVEKLFNQASFDIETIINKSAKDICNYLKINNLINVHPLIKKIDKIKEYNLIDYYKITDELSYTFPFINYTFKFNTIYYVAQNIDIINDNNIIMTSIALANMRVKIRNKTLIQENEGNTKIYEKTVIDCNPILLNYTYNQAKKSHENMLKRLNNR